MFDGVIQTLTHVKHILDKKKNLISLGMLNIKGCQWSVIDGVLCVVADDKVLLKGNKVKNIYEVEGDNVCGGEVNVAISQGELSYLWHMHMY